MGRLGHFMFCRQQYPKGCALAWRALKPDGPVEALHDSLYNEESLAVGA
jgi:hypothetical protein